LANWIENVVRPRIRSLLSKRETPENLWVKCPETGEMVFHKDLEANQFVFPSSGYHQRIDARTRFRLFFDDGQWETLSFPQVPLDPLRFRDERRYSERLKAAKAKTGLEDAVLLGAGTVDGVGLISAVQDFDFMGGSLGMAAAEAIIVGAEVAVQRRRPYVIFASSGGARMQEGILSLMQLPRTTIAIDMVKEAGLPYIVVLTNPTTGGVTASYAMLGDVQLAEPGALVGFAGPRVIEQTIREKLPEGFQRAEYLLDHGMIDMVVHRRDLKATLGQVIAYLTAARAA
jgi:acetyl-CoA carboxylase carboxyl transferase subunit beta